MNQRNSLRRWLRSGAGLAVLTAVMYAASAVFVTGDDTNTDKKPNPEKKTEQKAAPKTAPKAANKKFTGAELYAMHCNRCHPERYPTEWNSAQWKTLMTHMRVRASLPADQAKQILKYLQEDSGN